MFINHFCLIRNFALVDGGKTIFASDRGSFDHFTDQAFDHLGINYPKFYKMDRLSKAGFLAAEVLLKDQHLTGRYRPSEVAVVLSNASASLDTDLRFAETAKTIPSPGLFVYTLPNIVTGEICIRHGFQGENAFFVLPQFDAKVLADYTELVMAGEKTQACVSGWVEVMGEQHDVFLYLTEKKKAAGGTEHTADELQKIYTSTYGKIDGGSEKADH